MLAKDVLRTFPVRNYSEDHIGFSWNIKAAYERICILEEYGLLVLPGLCKGLIAFVAIH